MGRQSSLGARGEIGAGTAVGEACQLEDGVRIGDRAALGRHTFVAAYVVVGHDVKCGERCVLAARSRVYDEATLPDRARVNGFDVAPDDVACPTLLSGSPPSVVPASSVVSMPPPPEPARAPDPAGVSCPQAERGSHPTR